MDWSIDWLINDLIRTRRLFDPGPNQDDDGEEETTVRATEAVVTSQFVKWCSKSFALPMMKLREEQDVSASAHYQREWKFMRNHNVRNSSLMELEGAGENVFSKYLVIWDFSFIIYSVFQNFFKNFFIVIIYFQKNFSKYFFIFSKIVFSKYFLKNFLLSLYISKKKFPKYFFIFSKIVSEIRNVSSPFLLQALCDMILRYSLTAIKRCRRMSCLIRLSRWFTWRIALRLGEPEFSPRKLPFSWSTILPFSFLSFFC